MGAPALLQLLWLAGWRGTVLQCYLLPSLPGADHSFIVRNGEPIKPFRCLTEGGKPYLWKAYRIEGNNIGRPINISGFISAEGYLHFIVNDTLNTGYYYCVDAVDDQEIYEKYVLLTESECKICIGCKVLAVIV